MANPNTWVSFSVFSEEEELELNKKCLLKCEKYGYMDDNFSIDLDKHENLRKDYEHKFEKKGKIILVMMVDLVVISFKAES